MVGCECNRDGDIAQISISFCPNYLLCGALKRTLFLNNM